MADPSKPPIAIIGTGFRLPGGVATTAALWNTLHHGLCHVGPLPETRHPYWFHPIQPPHGGYLDDVAHFDAAFFGFKGLEACTTDPAQRLLLETVYWAFEDAGLDPHAWRGSETGVFIGAHTSDYHELALQAQAEVTAYWNAGVNTSMLANRISYTFDFHGPSLTLNTACSSSLEALVWATQALHSGRCPLAVVAGVNLILQPTVGLGAERAGMLSPDARCKTFDQGANGFVRGEGVVAVLLKPLAAALADGNRILGTLLAARSGHGGHAASVTAPNLKRQRDLIAATYRDAQLDPSHIQYIECHGTGTPLGDSVEVEALKEAFHNLRRESADPPQTPEPAPSCRLGSVKTNFGHLESAAGLLGVISVCTAFQHDEQPGLVGFREPGPLISLAGSPFWISQQPSPWPQGPKRAGVSGFGFGGALAHVILAEPPAPAEPTSPPPGPALLLLSARDNERLRQKARELAEHLKTARPAFADVLVTCARGRQAMEARLALLLTDPEQAIAALTAFADQAPLPDNAQSGLAPRHPKSQNPATAPTDLQTWAAQWVNGLTAGPPPQLPPGRLCALPGYPFARRPYWIEVGQAR